jgi:2'-5' RNA ligase
MSRRLRTFLAVDPGEAIRNRLVSLQNNLARATTDVKWVEEDNLHVTLLFLGEVDERDLAALCRAVGDTAAGHAAFTLSVQTVGCFPNPRRPRVLWAGVGAGSQELVALHDALEPPLLKLGCYRREERQYTPHITLGRVKSDRPPDRLAEALAKYAAWEAGETQVREVEVLSSELTPSGPAYTVLSRGRLSKQ